MDNIGFVLYKKGEEPGTLIAKWNHSEIGAGKGIATGGPVEGFEGKYTIRYFNHAGEEIVERGLTILRENGNYAVTWSKGGKITATGIGILVEEGLAAGWKNV